MKNWVLVTGGAKGIGKAISERLAAEGYDLILVGRDEAALSSFAGQLKKTAKIQIEIMALDLGASGAVADLFGSLKRKNIPIPHGMVCNAGDYGTLGPLSDVDIGEWKRSFDLNFFSVAELVQHYVLLAGNNPPRSRRKIVLMSGSGLGGSQVWPGISAYACAKAAIYRLMEVVHEEIYDKGFDINCVAPGAVKTGITDQAELAGEKALGKLYEATLKVKSQGGDSPELAAKMIVHLLSPQCDGLSGRLISAKWDRKILEDAEKAVSDPDLLRLRRIDNELFCKKS